MSDRARLSLRLRLIVGATIIALVAVFAAGLAAWGTVTTARLIERAASAQQRIDLLSTLSARISDYAVVAVETIAPDVPVDARAARLASQSERVSTAFAAIDVALSKAVAEVERDGEAEQMRRATRSLGVARMRAQFEALSRSVGRAASSDALRAYLDGFATQFSPLINDAIAEEQRDRNGARRQVADLRDGMIWLAVAVSAAAVVLVVLFYFALVRPLIDQLAHIRKAAEGIGNAQFDIKLPRARSRELNHVFSELTQSANRLKDRQAKVEARWEELNEIIAARTQELEEANSRLSRIDSDRRRFFADVGHELRTPLTVIMAESELGLQGPGPAGDATESLSIIHARARRLNRRIDDLLRVARSETGEIELNARPFDLAASATDAISDMAPLAKRCGIRIQSTVELAPTVGDRDWCRQVISGVIENALKKSPEGSIVEVTCTIADPFAVAQVIDEGPGLPDAELEAVFARFARGSRETMGSGFGVGLALARWVVERQDGSIDLHSPSPRPPIGGKAGGRGATVTISLPSGEVSA